MLFNSINYFLFLSAVFVIYYILSDRFRWILLLLASIFFYTIAGAAAILVPVVIILSTFFCGILIERSSNAGRKKTYFLLGLFVNLGLLIFFKYMNFIIATAFDGFNFINHLLRSESTVNHSSIVLQLVVPLGISYITFQAIGYIIEINDGNSKSEKNLGLFAAYLMFFPKLLSGPIERAHNFIPQLRQKHEFNYDVVVNGLKRILWGLFLKLVVANRLALYTDAVFDNFEQHSGITLLVASVFFTIQLYADFAGYTDMAIGSAQILGYRLMENFNSPFMAKSITEFWRRWHISLTSWIYEYIYNPLAFRFRKFEKMGTILAVFAVFIIVGLWHGASWTFIIFGLLQGFILTVEYLTQRIREKVKNHVPSWLDTIVGISFTFGYFCFSTIFFKANTATDAFLIIKKIFLLSGALYIGEWQQLLYCIAGVICVVVIEIRSGYLGQSILPSKTSHWLKDEMVYALIIVLILLIGVFDGGQFIYFKF